jgi:hypothetical protein
MVGNPGGELVPAVPGPRQEVIKVKIPQGVTIFPGDNATFTVKYHTAYFSDEMRRSPFYAVGCLAYSDHSDPQTVDYRTSDFPHTSFCFRSDTPMASIQPNAQIISKCGIDENAN